MESTNFKIPYTTKLACENEIQFAGFGRITFQWHAKSFTSSTWNASLAGIIVKHYAQQAKGQSEMILEGMDSISGLLDWWVQGQGKELRKVVWLTTAEAKNLKKVRAAKSAKSQTIQQICDKRFECMSTRLSNNQLKLLFSRKNIVSDWEDGTGDVRPTRIRPIWQSEDFNKIV
ncbi:hypothetical protein VP01_2441g4 [Puccinia sorghi]|uniref:Uncharacterized protein n=1 Tax=Puccinia sorghi TaxID=27349 RepID=A0A0L6V6X5_9BASI|nr:hypothetical protein VP01_2441g4 [Puccinia sorghi]